MRRCHAIAAAIGVLVSATAARGQTPAKYADPDAPAVKAAAKAALSTASILDIVATSLDIVGVQRDVNGLLRELNAKVTGQEIRFALSADVLFDFDKADLRAEAKPTLQKVLDLLKAYPNAPVVIEGHTDGKGTDTYNQPLSEKRAAAVKQWLVVAGAEAARMTTRGFGKTRPIAPNTKPDGSDDPEGRQKNRRVEIVVTTAK